MERKRRRRRSPGPSFTHTEFDALPRSVQRKYFSSLERLRIAESSLHAQAPAQAPALASALAPAPAQALPDLLSGLQQHPTLKLPTAGSCRRRLRKPQSVWQESCISHAEAQWFLSLPDKVRRRHFSREEQVLLLAGHTPRPLFGLPNDPLPLHPASSPSTAPGDGLQGRSDDHQDEDDWPPRGRTRRRYSSPHRSLRGFDMAKNSRGIDRRISYQDSRVHPPEKQFGPTTAAHFRRNTVSLSNIPFGRSSTSSARPSSSHPFSSGPYSWRPRAASQTERLRAGGPILPALDPEAAHYRDPEARQKLRVFLSSPQKFDEAVEFGFPASVGGRSPSRFELPPINADASNFSRDLHRFLKDDSLSFLDDKENDQLTLDTDHDSVTDMDSPITPSSAGVPFHSRARGLSSSDYSSLNSAGLGPMNPMELRMNRDMTLRMTLTRPDLRTDDDSSYGWGGRKGSKDDPLALEELHLSDDQTGARGAFAVNSKTTGHRRLVSRLFKKVKGGH